MIRSLTIALLVLSNSAGAAWATGNLDCAIDDKTSEFSASAIVPYDQGKPILQFRGKLNLKRSEIPKDLRTFEFDDTHLLHHWVHDRDVKLLLYRGRGESVPADVELAIETRRKPGEEVESLGRYELTLSLMPDKAPKPQVLKFRGQVSCSLG